MAILAGVGLTVVAAQPGSGPAAVAAHKAAAEKAAGKDFGRLKLSACSERETAPATPAGAPPAARQAPPREQWLAEPAKVFDNFYFIGTREHGAWALTTSAGIGVVGLSAVPPHCTASNTST
jgi:metallo-beta-lactamase class B